MFMSRITWVVALALALGAASFSGCSKEKPLTKEEKQKVDDDMQKAIEHNKSLPQ